MPTRVGPNTYGEENLVFGYDLGDTINSYKGEPTSNVVNDPRPTSAWGISNYLSTSTRSYGTDENGDPILIINVTSAGSGYPRSTGPYLLSTITGTFSTSFEAKSNINGTNIALNIYENGSTKTSNNANLTTKWQRFTFDNQSTGYTLDRPYLQPQDNAVYYVRKIQIEAKSHSTPFVDGTRSNTQGLLDLTGNASISLSNVSFDSNGQMTFDGTDDIINIPAASWNILTTHTLEAVFKANGTAFSGYHVMFQKEGGYSGGAVYGLRANNAGGSLLAMICYDAQAANAKTLDSTTTVTNGQYYHVVATFDSGYNWKIYINGVLENETTLTSNPYQNSSSIFIGRGDSRTMNGDLPIAKIYNRALTASEIKSNFNAIKGRFNI